jgi:SPP1 gp7 family putative phage head morphogenesis protein
MVELRTAAEIGLNGGVAKRPSAPPTSYRVRPDTSSSGIYGLNRFGGLVAEEYLPELRGVQKIEVFTKMASDGLVSALLMALELPVRAASWVVEPGGKDANALRARDLVEDQLFNRLGQCWESEVEKALAYLQYGFQVCAKNWTVENGEVVLSELRDLHPRTILQASKSWEFDDAGRLTGVWQYGNTGKVYAEEFIPASAMLHFVHRGRNGNPEGQSVLRAPYKHWLIKDMLYRVDAIGKERGGVGTPVGTYPSGATPDDQNALKEFCQFVQVSENGYFVGPEGTKLENFAVTTSTEGILASIQHHNTMMAMSLLAQWLNLGQEGSGGAYSLSADLTDLFLLSLETVGDYVAARINRHVIPEMVSYNIATDQYPRVSATIARQSASALAALVRPLTAGQNPPLYWADADEAWLRERLSLPEATEKRPKRVEVVPPGQIPPQEKDGEKQDPALSRRERIELHVFADPPTFGREKPAYDALGKVIREFGDGLRALGGTLRTDVWRIAGLPKPSDAPVTSSVAGGRVFKEKRLTYNEADLDAAIASFLAEFRGEEWTADAFVGDAAEDALLQGFLRLGHATGANHAAEGLGGATRVDLSRRSADVRAILSDAFQRLSKSGEVRLGEQLGDIKEIIRAGVESGESPLVTARTLSDRFDRYDRYEFERLARTEMAHAANAGSLAEYAAQGVREYEWIGDPSCAVCASFFGIRYPVGAGPVPPLDSHPQCLCGIAPWVAEGAVE